MKLLPFLAAGILASLAVVHLAYTIHDLVRQPRYFSPRDQSLLARMRTTCCDRADARGMDASLI